MYIGELHVVSQRLVRSKEGTSKISHFLCMTLSLNARVLRTAPMHSIGESIGKYTEERSVLFSKMNSHVAFPYWVASSCFRNSAAIGFTPVSRLTLTAPVLWLSGEKLPRSTGLDILRPTKQAWVVCAAFRRVDHRSRRLLVCFE